MNDWRSIIGVAAGLLAVSAAIPYCLSILRGATRPSWVTWGIWSVIGLVMLITYRGAGAIETIWLAVAYFVNPLLVCALSLRFGIGAVTTLDIACLCGAAISLAIWLLSGSALEALLANIVVDGFGALPTLRKSYVDPASENATGWHIAFLAALLNLAAIRTWTPALALYPLYALVLSGSIAGTLWWRTRLLGAGA